jgi:hypothetical protein
MNATAFWTSSACRVRASASWYARGSASGEGICRVGAAGGGALGGGSGKRTPRRRLAARRHSGAEALPPAWTPSAPGRAAPRARARARAAASSGPPPGFCRTRPRQTWHPRRGGWAARWASCQATARSCSGGRKGAGGAMRRGVARSAGGRGPLAGGKRASTWHGHAYASRCLAGHHPVVLDACRPRPGRAADGPARRGRRAARARTSRALPGPPRRAARPAAAAPAPLVPSGGRHCARAAPGPLRGRRPGPGPPRLPSREARGR